MYIFQIRVFDLLLGSASKSNFWQYFSWVRKVNLIDIEIEKRVILIKGF